MGATPGRMFQNDFHEAMGTWVLGYAPYGGADFGEVAAVAAEVADGDDDVFCAAWLRHGDGLVSRADDARAAGHVVTASDLLLRASAAYSNAYRPLLGAPIDPRLLVAQRRMREALEAGLELRPGSVAPFDIPFDGARMRANLALAEGHETERRPLIIQINGYDASSADEYFASSVAATRRGYHSLVFEGPGQGATLSEQGFALRPDFEAVLNAVLDHVADHPLVDADRIVISGWSLGGYFAPRAATSGDPRIAACIADPGQLDLGAGLGAFVRRLGASEEEARDPLNLPDAALDRIMAAIDGNRQLRWAIAQRGFWANGVTDLRAFLTTTAEFTSAGRLDGIRCPVLLTRGEGDPLAAGVGAFAEAIAAVGGRADVVDFTIAEGAGGHCEMMNRSLLNRRVLDWLGDVLAR